MLQDLTKIYEGVDLGTTKAGVIYLPIVRAATLRAVSVQTDTAQSGAAVFSFFLNGVEIEEAEVTIPNAERIGTATGLNVALAASDEITINLESGSVSSPITFNAVTDDGIEQITDANLLEQMLDRFEEGDNIVIEEVAGKIRISADVEAGATSLDDLDDVAISGETNGQVLKLVGGVWTNAAESGGSLPSQTGNAGKVLGTNGAAASWTALPFEMVVGVSDEGTTITTGNGKVTFRAPRAFRLTTIRASLNTASTSGIPAYRINKNGSTIFSTNLTVDATEKTSVTAATAFAFAGGATYIDFADDDEITIDVVTAGTGTKGLKIVFIGTRL